MEPQGLETADGHLSPCVQAWNESESCYQARTKAKINSDVLDPKIASEAISQHQIKKKCPRGACPQSPLASHSGTCTDKLNQCNFASTGPAKVFQFLNLLGNFVIRTPSLQNEDTPYYMNRHHLINNSKTWITNVRVMWTDEWVRSKCTQDSQKVPNCFLW